MVPVGVRGFAVHPTVVRRDTRREFGNIGCALRFENSAKLRVQISVERPPDQVIAVDREADEARIGQAASIGCIRMLNRDVIDLFERVETSCRVLIYE